MYYCKGFFTSILLALFIIGTGCHKEGGSGAANPIPPDTTRTDTGVVDNQGPVVRIIADSSDLVASVIYDTSFRVIKGVEEIDMQFIDKARSLPMSIYILKINLKEPSIKLVGALPYGESHLEDVLMPVSQIATYYDHDLHEVVGGVNGDFFYISKGIPQGVLVIAGEILSTNTTDHSFNYMGILKNGHVHFGDYRDFLNKKDSLNYAIGAGDRLVKNNKISERLDQVTYAPRTGIGIAGNEILYFIVIDGRDPERSNGMTLRQLADLFKSLGVSDAVNQDGGGSSTFITKNPVSESIEVRNNPSDGQSRPVGDAWLVISTKK